MLRVALPNKGTLAEPAAMLARTLKARSEQPQA